MAGARMNILMAVVLLGACLIPQLVSSLTQTTMTRLALMSKTL
ncbi:hypothetical protein AKJ16_DCAP11427 [Drosera capensis]